jgi:divalent metal cation (Fe/Co/Zn/Cd) transporter
MPQITKDKIHSLSNVAERLKQYLWIRYAAKKPVQFNSQNRC